MPLKLRHLALENFRSYESLDIICESNVCVIVGTNAAGKTNIIEAVQMVSGMESFRTIRYEDLIKWDSSYAQIDSAFVGDNREINLKLIIEGNKRAYYLNDKPRRLAQLKGKMPAVLFCPDNLRMIKDESKKRRDALDSIGVQLSSTYASLKYDYEKIIKQRNKLLKEQIIDLNLIDSWTASLILIGSRFFVHRHNLFNQIKSRIVEIYEHLVDNEVLDVVYKPSLTGCGSDPTVFSDLDDVRGAFSAAVDSRRGEELERKTTLVGPHRDEIVFTIDGKDARSFASQGQQRTIVLAWKLAEVEVISQIAGQPPILLLDDVMSELDENRRKALVNYAGSKVQTFITTTTTDVLPKDLLDNAQIIKIGP